VHFSIEKWTSGGTEHIYDSSDWAHPLFMEFGQPFPVAAGEGLQWTCSYDNTTGAVVTAGQNSTDEMCMTFAYAYPTGSLSAAPYQCNNFTP
jgi:hypothetical protein